MNELFENIKEVFGIYKLTNKINKKIYIGKANNLYNRIMEHKRAKSNTLIHFSIKKYNWNNFEVEILAEFENIDNLELLALETAFIEYYNSTNKKIGYNICLFSNDTTGTKRTIESKLKMSKNNARFMLGKRHSQNTKNKMSLKCKLQKHCYKPVAIKQINKKTNEIIKIWNSIKEASNSLNIHSTNIVAVCKQKIHKGSMAKTCGGFKWEYLN